MSAACSVVPASWKASMRLVSATVTARSSIRSPPSWSASSCHRGDACALACPDACVPRHAPAHAAAEHDPEFRYRPRAMLYSRVLRHEVLHVDRPAAVPEGEIADRTGAGAPEVQDRPQVVIGPVGFLESGAVPCEPRMQQDGQRPVQLSAVELVFDLERLNPGDQGVLRIGHLDAVRRKDRKSTRL